MKLRMIRPMAHIVGWEAEFNFPHGRVSAQGIADKRLVRHHVHQLICRTGPEEVAAMIGCDCTANGIMGGIDIVTSEVAFRNLAGMLGISPLSLIRRGVTQSLNKGLKAGLYANPLYQTYKGAQAVKRLLKRKGKTPAESEQSQDSENPQETESPQAQQDSENPQPTQEEGETTMGDYDIGEVMAPHFRNRRRRFRAPTFRGDFDIGAKRGKVSVTDYHVDAYKRNPPNVGDFDIACAIDGLSDTERTAITFAPGGAQALQAMRLTKLARSKNARISNAARILHSAKKGDKNSIRKIATIRNQAKSGDPEAKDALKRLKKVDRVVKAGLPSGGKGIRDLYRAGIQR